MLAAAAAGAVAGCGKSGTAGRTAAGVELLTTTVAAGTPATATRNTTRLGGANPISDAAAVARTAYPGLTPQTRPQAVVIADAGNWPAALAASALAAAPLGAPLLYAQGSKLPQLSARALQSLAPTGASVLGGAQVLLAGTSIRPPAGYRVRGASQADPDALAVSIAQLLALVRGGTPKQVIVVDAAGPPALAMPAAGLAAQTGAPILFVSSSGVPAATAGELQQLHRPTIYTVGSSAIDQRTLQQLARFGTVRPVESSPQEDATVAGNAVAVARFSDGAFGWGIVEPGHGLVFANATRPLDAPAAAILSATGDYAPLMLLANAERVPTVLRGYLSDIQPAAPHSQPVRGVYNHGWLIGDESAISADAQAELDAMLEIQPRSTTGARGQPGEEPTATIE
jgi:Cell wall binding domain 2 (CWB2)